MIGFLFFSLKVKNWDTLIRGSIVLTYYCGNGNTREIGPLVTFINLQTLYKYMKKSLIIASFLTVLIVPSVTLAAWYNPLSWFKKPVTVQIEAPVAETSVIATTTPEVKPVPPVSTFSNNITVTDPKLQGQINTLIQQNTTLQTQIVSLTTQYNSLVAQNASLKEQLASANKAISAVAPSNAPEVQKVSVAPSDVAELIINTLPGGDNKNLRAFTLTNNSDATEKIMGFYFDSYNGLPMKIAVSETANSPALKSYDATNGPVEIDLDTPIYLSAHHQIEIYVAYDGYVKNMTGILRAGPDVLVGFPININ